MKNKLTKRLLSVALAVLMIVTLLPANAVHVHATVTGTLDVDGLGLSESGSTTTASGNMVTISVEGAKYWAKNGEVTLKNNKSDTATLTFDYEVTQSGEITIDGATATGPSGSFSKELPAGQTITIRVKAAAKTSAQLKLTNIQLFSNSTVTTTFVPTESGSYTVDGVAVTAETSKTQLASESYQLVATPAAGYQFLGWYNVETNECLGTAATMALTSTANQKVTAKFISANAAVFETAGANFADLNEAVAYAQKKGANQITLVSSGTVPAGDYTIPAGITLLVPDSSNTVYTEAVSTGYTGIEYISATVVAWSKPTAYKTMTMAAGANITVNGAICVGGKHSAQTYYSGSPTQSVGMINMLDGSSITLNSGANLYCWGFIYGSGEITAKNGAFVHENFQITDFRGGTATSGMATDFIVFPLSQYYVQNVEVATTYEYGAHLKVWTTIFMSKKIFSAGVDFIGEGAMFVPAEGASVTKTYDPKTDRLHLEISGSASINPMALELGGSNVQSQNFPLPINSNISIFIHSGTTTLKQTVALLPGSELTVDRGAELVLETGTVSASDMYTGGENLFIYDADEWNYGINLDTEQTVNGTNYVYSNRKFSPVAYTPSRTYNRTNADLKDVVVNINGTLTAKGFVYTTAGGASIISSEGTGKFFMESGAGSDTLTFQATQADTAITYLAIPIVSAMLKNADGSYTETAGAEAGATYGYKDGKWVKLAAPHDHVDDNMDHVCDVENCDQAMGQHAAASGSHTCAYCGKPASECVDTNKDHACDVCGAAMGQHAAASGSHTCAYCGKPASICADNNNDHNCDICGAELSQCADNEKDHLCDICGEKLTECEDKDGDGTHFCYICEKPMDTACHGGIATCQKKAVCTDCGEEYGDLDKTNHVSTELKYASVEGKQHNVIHVCCDTLKETVGCEDTNDDHKCDLCEAVISDHVGGEANCEDQAVCEICKQTYGDLNKNNHIGDTDNDHLCNGCGDKLSDCKDENNDHNCDICGEKYSDCADRDNDHYCDVCNEKLSDCKDENNNHACDICGAKLSDCKDENKDHCCDICGTVMGKHVQADGKHTCDYCGQVMSHCSDTDNDGDHKCDICGAENVSGHIGGTADCQKQAVCSECGQSYGDKDFDKHVSSGVNIVDNKNGTHTRKHLCCGTDIETVPCAAGEKSHNCEGCNAKLSDCGDADKNHKCDICEASMGVHEQAPGKHTCDYCGEEMSECFDAANDFDHKCDICGAENVTKHFGGIANCRYAAFCSECAQPYGEVNKDNHMGDSNRDHLCNGCGEKLSDCKDEDPKNHKCDICGTAMGNHVQAPGKHTCDYCGEEMSKCSDVETDKDHNCDVCGQENISSHEYESVLSEIKPGAEIYYTFTCNCGDSYKEYTDGMLNVGNDIYYINDDGTPVVGLMRIEENGHVHYYYFNAETCKAEKAEPGQTKLVVLTITNGFENGNGYGIPVGQSFLVDENGVLVHDEDTRKNGFVKEGDKIINYVDGIKVYRGLMKIGEDLYYVRSNGELVVGRDYYVSRTNGLMDVGEYTFDAEGKMILEGIVNGYYYKDGKLQKCGLFEYEGNFYYARTSTGELITGRNYWITKTNGLTYMGDEIQPASYYFDADGKMTIRQMRNGIVEEGGKLYYYENDKLVYAGLIEINGDYYYVRSNGEVVTGRNYWITKTNGIMEAANYTFDADGKLVK